MKWMLMVFALSVVGCSKENKSCPESKECGEGLKCVELTNMCRARCAKDNDCGKGLTCETKHNVCIDPILIKEKKRRIEEEREEERKRKLRISTLKKIQWVKIKGGTFNMGSNKNDYEKPIHKVTVPSFEIMKTEITVEMYRMCVEAGKCEEPKTGKYCNWNKSNRENHPVNCVTWHNVNDFAKWVGARLPSEAEWEYAARGGDRDVKLKYPWGNNDPDCSYADFNYNNSSCNGDGTSSVCNTPKGNSLDGLCDMAGNVWEWVQDSWHDNYNGAPNDGSAWTTNTSSSSRVFRGGVWNSSEYGLRVANRGRVEPAAKGYNSGGRLSRSMIP